ncbi:serine/threonine-protein kinase [Nocardiopsis sp. MG754419]|uniref:serine/threonine-protein kinase n=1 Tax=Nocardiopsis sp. MG754419 TaxID=2259865 RepID=UPI001BA5322C|nr:serine/threonine-protein kinase [Nocardiopsis sp. MG754419]MBR8744481.1 serine/threonine protein kinase [Nocardiopsis sp. MG754419]
MSSNSERPIADRYVLLRELGRGGMGIVWEAHDTALDRVVAIKQVLLPGHFTEAERDDAHARVRREARSAARVNHPTVITIHDVFEHEHNPWVVMELVEGGSLQEMLAAEGALPPDRVAEIAVSLLEAVRAADAAGVLHRDIKPGNIMMSSDGRVILTDFGIATVEGGPSITRTGALIGSPEYMPPERLEGAPADHRGDLWSIGVTLYAAVEGSSPFRRDNITAAIAAVISAPLPATTRAGRLEPVISGLLERDPDRRLTVEQALGLLRDHRSGTGASAVAGVPSGPSGPQEAPETPEERPHEAHSGGYPGHQAHSGGYPGHEAHSGGHPGHGADSGGHPGFDTHSGGYQGRAHDAGYSTGHHHGGGYYAGGSYPNAGAYAAPATPPPAPERRSRRGVVFGLVSLAMVLLLVAGLVVFLGTRDTGPTVAGSEGQDEGREERRDDGAGQNEAPVAAHGTPPEYDEDDLRPYSSEWFTISHPGGWEVGEEALENSYASFIAPGLEHQVEVDGWEETDFTGTSAEFLAESRGGTDIDGDVTRDYTVLDEEDFDRDDFEGGLAGLDVAWIEADLVNDTWDDPERRFWAYAVILEQGDHRVFYLVTVNVPREQAGDFDEVHEDVIETFTPLQ